MANKKTIVGKTAPVPLGQQKAVNSLPVVFAEDQPPIPVEEQNKIQSEVALSLLGIPRAEVALGIFADVNTYDINPNEWSQFPLENDLPNAGCNHLAKEAGAELIAGEKRTTILTSKRFFRYQPGRVSSSTMGVKMNKTASTYLSSTDNPNKDKMKGAPCIKKWGIFDKFDGYYFEIANGGDKNDFRCVRRTQAVTQSQPIGIETTSDAWNVILETPVGNSNIKAGNWGVAGVDPIIFRNGLALTAAAINDPSLCYAPGSVAAIEAGGDLNDYEFDENYAVRLAYKNTTGGFVEHLSGRKFQFPFDQKDIDKSSSTYLSWRQNNQFLLPASEYIRLDAHCMWDELVTNLSRGGGSVFTPQITKSGNKILANPDDARFKYDTAPSEAESGVKVWNLLVSVQGDTPITAAQFSTCFSNPHRASTSTYDPTSTASSGVRNVTLKEWFKLCVPKQYRMVYEWRPVRSMFSGDQLNGETNTVRWSDVTSSNVDPTDISVKRPGDPVVLDNQILEKTSVYNIDFSKVTMWKIEFSWYGAVGALFLCYVPVGNGEARWVRVHHMRASNQLDVASLGNATLPITYLTHGGLSNGLSTAGGSQLVKYGASYYIDGGDKGTVKLLSKSTDYGKGNKYGGLKTPASDISTNSLTITFDPNNRDQLIGAYLKSDSTTSVIWADNTTDTSKTKLYFNKNVSSLTSGASIELIIPRRQRAMIALRAKDEVINTSGVGVRNRIQLYPIKYGVGVTDPSTDDNIVSINFIKNPLLITNNLSNAALTSSVSANIYSASASAAKGFELGAGTLPKEIVSGTNITSGHYTTLNGLLSSNGKYFYAYMRGMQTNSVQPSGFPAAPAAQEFAALVRFFKKNDKIYIQNYESQSTPISVQGNLMPVRMYTFTTDGDIQLFTDTFTHNKFENQKKWDEPFVGNWESIASISGASVSQDFKLAPVANTGSNIFSIYSNKGGDQYSLTDYFAYNKEYISFPLTNEVDVLCAYAFWESTSSITQPTASISIVNSLTWEEQ